MEPSAPPPNEVDETLLSARPPSESSRVRRAGARRRSEPRPKLAPSRRLLSAVVSGRSRRVDGQIEAVAKIDRAGRGRGRRRQERRRSEPRPKLAPSRRLLSATAKSRPLRWAAAPKRRTREDSDGGRAESTAQRAVVSGRSRRVDGQIEVRRRQSLVHFVGRRRRRLHRSRIRPRPRTHIPHRRHLGLGSLLLRAPARRTREDSDGGRAESTAQRAVVSRQGAFFRRRQSLVHFVGRRRRRLHRSRIRPRPLDETLPSPKEGALTGLASVLARFFSGLRLVGLGTAPKAPSVSDSASPSDPHSPPPTPA
jgi:hypothetical protein